MFHSTAISASYMWSSSPSTLSFRVKAKSIPSSPRDDRLKKSVIPMFTKALIGNLYVSAYLANREISTHVATIDRIGHITWNSGA